MPYPSTPTPTPWFYKRSAYTPEGSVQAELIEDAHGQIVARVDYRDTEYGEPGREMRDAGPANARLIVAGSVVYEHRAEIVTALNMMANGAEGARLAEWTAVRDKIHAALSDVKS